MIKAHHKFYDVVECIMDYHFIHELDANLMEDEVNTNLKYVHSGKSISRNNMTNEVFK